MAGKVTYNDRVWREMRRALKKIGEGTIRVGVLASKGGNAPHDASGGISLIELAAIHEFGAPAAGIPERSFIRKTFKLRQRQLTRAIAKLANLAMLGRMPPEKALEILGAWSAGQVRDRILSGEGIPPPLKPETVRRKGSSRPLVDTGRLLQAITYEVTFGGAPP